MILASGRAAPLRFLIAVMILWVAGRGAMLSGWPAASEDPRRGPAPGRLLAALPRAAGGSAAPHPPRLVLLLAEPVPAPVATRHTGRSVPSRAIVLVPDEDAPPMRRAARGPPPPAAPARAPAPASPATAAIATPPAPGKRSRLSGSAWVFVRQRGGGALAPDGQLGGSQAGTRLLYRLRGGLSAAARVSGALGGPRQTEAAVGLDWQPVRTVPVHVMLDRRIAIDRGGRDAWALGVAGGAYDLRPVEGVRIDGYAQAGVVGARARDLYADGAVRAGRELALGRGGATVTIGGGAWGVAQPGAARLDIGPSAVLRLPIDKATLAVALDGRLRIAGRSRPGSGAALTVGIDF